MSKTPFEAIFFDLGDTWCILTRLVWYFPTGDEWATPQSSESGDRPGQEFVDEFTQRMAEYYRERDTEFIEYTIKHVLKNILEEKGYLAVPDKTLTDALADMHLITQAHWIPETDTIQLSSDWDLSVTGWH